MNQCYNLYRVWASCHSHGLLRYYGSIFLAGPFKVVFYQVYFLPTKPYYSSIGGRVPPRILFMHDNPSVDHSLTKQMFSYRPKGYLMGVGCAHHLLGELASRWQIADDIWRWTLPVSLILLATTSGCPIPVVAVWRLTKPPLTINLWGFHVIVMMYRPTLK